MTEYRCRIEYELRSRTHQVLSGLVVRPRVGRHEDAATDPYEMARFKTVRII